MHGTPGCYYRVRVQVGVGNVTGFTIGQALCLASSFVDRKPKALQDWSADGNEEKMSTIPAFI